MGITNDPVIFVPAGSYDVMLTGTDPLAELTYQLRAKGSPWTALPNWDPSQGGAAPPSTFRIYMVVLSKLGADVEGVGNPHVVHGEQTGQPVVELASGPAPKPSSDPTRTSTPRLGDTTIDWIDAPPPGFAAVGTWSFDQSLYFLVPIHGAAAVLHLQVAGGSTVLVAAIVNALQLEQAWDAVICDGAVPDLDSVYDDCDNSPNPAVVKGTKVTVRLRWVDTHDNCYVLFVFLEPST